MRNRVLVAVLLGASFCTASSAGESTISCGDLTASGFKTLESEQTSSMGELGFGSRRTPEGPGWVAVVKVEEDGPADQAGLMQGDNILGFDGVDLDLSDTAASVYRWFGRLSSILRDEEIVLKVERGGEQLSIKLHARQRSLRVARSFLAIIIGESCGEEAARAYRSFVAQSSQASNDA